MDPFEPRLILLLVKKKKKKEGRNVGGVWLIWPFERQLHGGRRSFSSVDVDGLHPRRSNEKYRGRGTRGRGEQGLTNAN